MHGAGAHTAGRLYSEQLLEGLNIPLCRDWQQVGAALDNGGLAFMPLVDWAPQLQRMIDLRNTLGLRSPIHSLTRILNPLNARCGLQSIFHPGYQAVHRDASGLLGWATRRLWSRAMAAKLRSTRMPTVTCTAPLAVKAGTKNGRKCRPSVTSNQPLSTLSI